MRFFVFLLVFLINGASYGLEERAILRDIKKLGKDLKVELKKGMSRSPKNALQVCNIKAPEIEKKYSKDKLKLGRVSLKSRNSNNKAKQWMVKYIDKFHRKEIEDPYVFIKVKKGQIGFLKPILTMPLCLKCHGENIDKELSEDIYKLYPNDKARGYKVGDIRGFYWAEYSE